MSSTNPNDPMRGRQTNKERKAAYNKGYAKRMKEITILPGDLRHGTATGYKFCNCKCTKCVAWYEAHK